MRTPEEIAQKIESESRWDTKETRLSFRRQVSIRLVRAGMAEAFREAVNMVKYDERVPWSIYNKLECRAEECGG